MNQRGRQVEAGSPTAVQPPERTVRGLWAWDLEVCRKRPGAGSDATDLGGFRKLTARSPRGGDGDRRWRCLCSREVEASGCGP